MNLPLCAMSIFSHSSPSALSLALIALPLLVLLVVLTIARRRREEFPAPATASATAREGNRHWIAGLVYANSDDPALVVRKRSGVGWTLNFGHWLSWLFMALLLSVPALVGYLSRRH
ncbi:MAG TPA: DUF5808 domain-containing protein [Candidatus Dormibacteraeota bacterium]|nr:DUF5808 domain-containing protein [Candidatus Dormibacteraeota bacterium]